MERYKQFFSENSIPKYYKRKPISLLGKIKGKSYRIDIAPTGKGLVLDGVTITENNNLVYMKNNREGGTVDQLLSKAFIEVFHLPVPINHDDVSGSGLDLNYMIYMLIENLDFKINRSAVIEQDDKGQDIIVTDTGKKIPLLKIRVMKEAKQAGIMYHYTKYDNLLSILKDDMIMKGEHNYISFTRNKRNIKSGLACQIVLDGDKLSNRYKIEPFDYFNMTGEDEQEERVLTRVIKNVHQYIREINIENDEEKFKYQVGRKYGFDFFKYMEDLEYSNDHHIKINIV